ncbi:hypothetical protein [Lysobacter sp. CA199]|uniref:hypothetical protein n=1 Tax=Lysobacter sp. CA199 TaxID=3455608 RepID=UPI003F8D2733
MSRYLPIAAALLALPHLLAAASRHEVAVRMDKAQGLTERTAVCAAQYDRIAQTPRRGERLGVVPARRYLQP